MGEEVPPEDAPKINKVHVRPGRPFQDGNFPNMDKCLSSLPLIADRPAVYSPMPYTFRMPPSESPRRINNVYAKSPPFNLLLDHTIAVVWMIFSKTEYDTPLGIVQLQWALAFLKTIYSRHGDHPPDIELCIDNIHDILLELYADLASEMPTIKKIDESRVYADGAVSQPSVVTKQFPNSLNYEVISRKWNEAEENKAATGARSLTTQEAEEELENIKRAAGVDSIENLDSVSRDKAICVLKMWYHEQTTKIRDEMKRLRSIEDMMKSVDDEVNFEGFVDASQMELLFSNALAD